MKSSIILALAALALLAVPRTASAQYAYGEAYIASFPEGNSADVYGSATVYCDDGELCLTPGVVATIDGPGASQCASGYAWGVSGEPSWAEVDLGCTVVTSGYAYIYADFYSHDEPDGPDDMGYEVGEDTEDAPVDLDATPSISGISPSSWTAGGTQYFTVTGTNFGTSPSITVDAGSSGVISGSDTSISAYVDLTNSADGTATVTVTSNGYGGMGFLEGPSNSSPTSPSANAQITAPPPAISISGEQAIDDGEQGSFGVSVLRGVPISYAWSFWAPYYAGNSPEVTFTPGAGPSVTTDGHWFASPNLECSAQPISFYDITATVGFGSGPLTATTSLSINALWYPGGYTPTPSIDATGGYAWVFQGGRYVVSGIGNYRRVAPTDSDVVINVPSNSQFHNKTFKHEHVHVTQFQPGGIFADLMGLGGLWTLMNGLSDTTLSGLTAQVNAAMASYTASQLVVFNQGIPEAERQAYAVSDTIPPQYIYDNCGRY